MPKSFGENEGFDILPEFVSTAIPEPGAIPPNAAFGTGTNGGMDILDEIVVDLSGQPAQAGASVLDTLPLDQLAAIRSLVADGSLGTVAQKLGVTPPQAREVLLAAFESLRSRLAG